MLLLGHFPGPAPPGLGHSDTWRSLLLRTWEHVLIWTISNRIRPVSLPSSSTGTSDVSLLVSFCVCPFCARGEIHGPPNIIFPSPRKRLDPLLLEGLVHFYQCPLYFLLNANIQGRVKLLNI